jgi:alcohol dehydrogenase YqhD (iron-dependent ADH family)
LRWKREDFFKRVGIKMTIKERSMDDKVMVIANKNTTKNGIKTKLVRRQGVKRNQGKDR